MSNEVEQWKQRAEKAETESARARFDRNRIGMEIRAELLPKMTVLQQRAEKADAACAEMRSVLERFVAKVDAGLARSTETYNAAKRALSPDCGKDHIHRDVAVNKLADAFIACPLPDSVCSDQCACIRGYKHRSGTNLLTVEEARQMFSQILETLRKESK